MPSNEYNETLSAAKRNLISAFREEGIGISNVEAEKDDTKFVLVAYFTKKLSCSNVHAAAEKFSKTGKAEGYKITGIMVRGYRDQLMLEFEASIIKSRSKDCFGEKKPEKKAKPAKKAAAKKK